MAVWGFYPQPPLYVASMSSEPSCSSVPLRPPRTDDRLIDSFDVHLLDLDSTEYLLEFNSLLNSPSKITLAKSFQGGRAQSLIDFLHQVSCSCPPWPDTPNLWRGHRSWCGRDLTTTSGGGPCGLLARFPKRRGFYPRRISFKPTTYALGLIAPKGHLES